ncbi:integrase [Candidatus Shapirobacteria bacterium CG_4_8_14_3_um_filter_35_11]|uniref:Integrase n=1 Tax=Candidatus Shapirobacteria bacterium CG_4_8_14_3_um_filter_35_11 TaxID=1974874 RepID=A0A2M8GK22_9BACT|nr:MAG: integrase [bacterium CG_4_9_14_3_um_filter_33_26]PJC80615.1 MAG: integrase [Candidatus Shapirobacteria bacterium CG_4_8_14_3_um_filter_35_11]
MNTTMDDSRLNNISEIADFLKSSKMLVLKLNSTKERYQFIDKTIDKFNYSKIKKKEKRIIIHYLTKITGYKKAQIMRLIKRSCLGKLVKKKYLRTIAYHRIYTSTDIKLLERTDEYHNRLNSMATKEILRREYEVYGMIKFQNISKVSVSHINNLRHRSIYRNYWVNGTKSRDIPIGITEAPEANNQPGSIRVDTVHQRNVFYINAVDEVTQWEIVVCIPEINEYYLLPVLEQILKDFPFIIFNFHSDRGSEFINYLVAEILNRLLIRQTKSRSRHCNDNALVEGKNGSVIRKNMGYHHINQQSAKTINTYLQNYFNPYLNFHRPCLFPEDKVLPNGQTKHTYKQAMTPFTKLKEISKTTKTSFLKPEQSWSELDKIEKEFSDNQFAEILRKEEKKLFDFILLTSNKSSV